MAPARGLKSLKRIPCCDFRTVATIQSGCLETSFYGTVRPAYNELSFNDFRLLAKISRVHDLCFPVGSNEFRHTCEIR